MDANRKSITWPVFTGVAFVGLLICGLLGYFVFFQGGPPSTGPAVTAALAEPAATQVPETQKAIPTIALEEGATTPEESTPTPSAEPPTVMPTEVPEVPLKLLLLGIGTRSPRNEADAIYVLNIYRDSGTIDVTTFAPSMVIEAEDDQERLEWIWREAFYGNEQDDEAAALAVAAAIDRNYDITVEHYAVVREDSIAALVDSIDGLEVDVPEPYDDILSGRQHFDGQTTWRYAAWLPATTGVATDLERIDRQKHVLDALADRLSSPAMLLRLPAMTRQLLRDGVIRTDMATSEVLDTLDVLRQISDDRITVTVISVDG